MEEQKHPTQAQLLEKAVLFYDHYKNELEEATRQLAINLNQLALAYSTENKLPKEAVSITTRMKTLDSFLKKLMRKGYASFLNPAEFITDLIGGRITCWFLEDCYGILNQIRSSKNIITKEGTLEDYIHQPKKTGYRSIHILANILSDTIETDDCDKLKDTTQHLVCEIQIRTKLQNFWGELTHETHHTGKEFKENQSSYEKMVTEMADRFATEDQSTFALRNLYQTIVKGNLNKKT